MLSFVSLDICICPVECDESLAWGNIMKKETSVFTRVNIHLFISLDNIHRVTLGVTCHLYKWSDGTYLTKTKWA
jgi:hypothetical protein